MTVKSRKTTTSTRAAMPASTARAMAGTTGALETRAQAAQQDLAVGDTAPQPADWDNYIGVITDDFFDAHVGANRGFKFGIGEMIKAAGELRQIKQTLGDRFYAFARVRLGLTPALADFLLRVAEMNLDPAQFSPAVEMRMPRLLEVLGLVVRTYEAVTGAARNGAQNNNVSPATATTSTTTGATRPVPGNSPVVPGMIGTPRRSRENIATAAVSSTPTTTAAGPTGTTAPLAVVTPVESSMTAAPVVADAVMTMTGPVTGGVVAADGAVDQGAGQPDED